MLTNCSFRALPSAIKSASMCLKFYSFKFKGCRPLFLSYHSYPSLPLPPLSFMNPSLNRNQTLPLSPLPLLPSPR
ncbi:hypothetical protein KUF71_014553 [Frankliniella fusca]|uniref:Uncharacterized protein n=1 Tax=Frankliniella fusca TaxID=407009 RepID=A0AAE1HRS4_9NEOP|nr:hypothetical protein KUF71_014553 [Frankliniella fusca]